MQRQLARPTDNWNGSDVLCKQKVQIENILLQLPRAAAYLNKLAEGVGWGSEVDVVQFVCPCGGCVCVLSRCVIPTLRLISSL